MPLIKANLAPPSAKPFSMTDIEGAARRILLTARRQAENLLSEAQLEAAALRQRAVADGHSEGQLRGHAEGLSVGQKTGHDAALAEHRQRFTEAFNAVSAAAAAVEASRRDLESQALAEVIELAIAIARRVTKRQGLLDPAVLAANLSEAMRLVVHAADLRIAIHPDQRAVLAELLPKLQLQWPTLAHVELIDDPALAPGGCRIFTRNGAIDADLDAQLDRVVADLLPSPPTGGAP